MEQIDLGRELRSLEYWVSRAKEGQEDKRTTETYHALDKDEWEWYQKTRKLREDVKRLSAHYLKPLPAGQTESNQSQGVSEAVVERTGCREWLHYITCVNVDPKTAEYPPIDLERLRQADNAASQLMRKFFVEHISSTHFFERCFPEYMRKKDWGFDAIYVPGTEIQGTRDDESSTNPGIAKNASNRDALATDIVKSILQDLEAFSHVCDSKPDSIKESVTEIVDLPMRIRKEIASEKVPILVFMLDRGDGAFPYLGSPGDPRPFLTMFPLFRRQGGSGDIYPGEHLGPCDLEMKCGRGTLKKMFPEASVTAKISESTEAESGGPA